LKRGKGDPKSKRKERKVKKKKCQECCNGQFGQNPPSCSTIRNLMTSTIALENVFYGVHFTIELVFHATLKLSKYSHGFGPSSLEQEILRKPRIGTVTPARRRRREAEGGRGRQREAEGGRGRWREVDLSRSK